MPHIGEFEPRHTNGAASAAVTPTGSPYTYPAPRDGLLVITGGTVTLIEYGRTGTFTTLGITAGPVNVLAGDSVRVTYSVAPTITMIPF